MKVKDKMKTLVKTIDLDKNLNEAFRIMKDNNIRRLPVVDKDKPIAIVTLSDLNKLAPSSATSLSVHEINYILAKTKIKDIISKKQKLITVEPENYIETAAKLMRINKISGLPVVENGKLVGIITETDIFDAFIEILGVKKTHSRIDFFAREKKGSLAEITTLISEKDINILNIVAYYDEEKEKYRLILRLEELNCEPIVEELKARGYEIESIIVRESI